MGVNHTDAVRRKARKPGKCAKASTKQRISTFFALHGVQRDDFAGSTSAQSTTTGRDGGPGQKGGEG